DVESFNEWKFSNCALTLRNDRHQFLEGNPAGLFPDGTLIYGSKVIIRAGAVLPDGSESLVNLFTGYIKADPAYDHENRQLTVTVMDQTYLLEDTNAENISTLVSGELLGSDSGADFVCANPAVGLIVSVKKGQTAGGPDNAEVLKPDTDYTVSGLNAYASGASVKLETALITGESVWAGYRRWYRDKPLEWIVAQCCTASGIADTEIAPAQFSVDAKNIFSQTDKAAFDSGTADNADYTSGDISLAYNAFEFPVTADAQSTGAWYFSNNDGSRFLACDSDNLNGYKAVHADGNFYLYRVDNGADTLLASAWVGYAAQPIITRDSAGVFTLYLLHYDTLSKSGVLAADSAYWYPHNTTEGWQAFHDFDGAGLTARYAASGFYLSPEIDGTESLSSWGKLSVSETKPDGTDTVMEFRERDFDGVFGGWTEIASGGTIPASKQIIQLRWTAYSDSAQTRTPTLGSWSFEYFTSRTTIPVVNFTGLSCLDAIKQLAEMCAYEIGFNANDAFIFRPRAHTSEACAELNASDYIEPEEIGSGIERVYNHVTVEFGGYTCVANPAAMGDASPNSIEKYGLKKYSISSGNFLPAENVDLAYAIAPTVYAYSKTPRAAITLKCRFLLYPELGDVVSLTVNNDDVLRLWRWGDPVKYGQDNLAYWTEDIAKARLMFYKKTMRIEGIEFDLENWTISLALTEAL
ncbi:MAG: hypothetical protein WCS77_08370, partial [Elusimicrobiaceae bacterium]